MDLVCRLYWFELFVSFRSSLDVLVVVVVKDGWLASGRREQSGWGVEVWFPGGSVFTFVQLRCVIEFNVLLVRIFRLSVFFGLSHVS